MRYRTLNINIKNPDWKILDVVEAVEGGKSFTNVSINRNDKKTGAVAFHNFDQIVLGYEFEATPWTNPEGKLYLFAPKTAPATRGGGANIAKAQEVKAENIEKAQDRKNDAIARAGAFRDATLVTLQSLKDQPFPDNADFKREWENWVKYFLGKANEPFI